MADYEKLGLLYLGRAYDPDRQQRLDDLLLYDSRDLVTHAVCVGMTGSGKTGLCLGILEEAALDGVAAIAIDPKGDLGNLLLTFPGLSAAEFAPWVSAEEARRRGLSVEAFAAQQADAWRNGLTEWQQDGARIARLREAAEFVIYTPGSTAGRPLSLLRSFAPPPEGRLDESEWVAERAATAATGLLSLVGVDADPLTSREHILLSNLLVHAWTDGVGLGLADLVERVQRPPLARVGVVDLEAFYPEKERFALAMRLNNLLASPATAAWMAGDPLDVAGLLHTPTGKPKLSVISIAHLGDAERQFVVSLVLNELIGWMRKQSGTESLRAIFYMDEIAGYFPPVANPPAKGPLLTLLKQGRAFGVGAVLATQNPVDLDYKGLSNTGTWFIGRLQTDRDRQRVLDALQGSPGAPDPAALERTIGQLGKRIFLMHNVHEPGPTVFETRWTLSYLRGPLTREQIRQLTPAGAPTQTTSVPATGPGATAPPSAAAAALPTQSSAPVLPPGIKQYFCPADPGAHYDAALYAATRLEFSTKEGSIVEERAYLVPFGEGAMLVDWSAATPTDVPAAALRAEPEAGATFGVLPEAATKAKQYAAWQKDFARWVAHAATLDIRRSPTLKLASAPGESERDFLARVQHAARERRDVAVEQLRQKYAPRVAGQAERVRRAEQAQARESEQASHQRMQTAVSFGATVLGAILGRKTISGSTIGRATTAARGMGRSRKEAQDVARAGEQLQVEKERLAQLETELAAELARLEAEHDPSAHSVETSTLKPKRGGVSVTLLALVWTT